MLFDKILIANRGEIAARIVRTCRALGITTVAVYSAADRTALHVREADEARFIGPAPATESYLNVAKIIDAARQSGAQAIHPGYGFLSERAHFARACHAAGLVFIGPPAEAIELMGSKIAAKRLAESVGVPTAPGYTGDDQSVERLRTEAERIGFPLLIKASAGGGGKGMRTVTALSEFDSALEGAQREARGAFGDDTVFLERLILRPRHIELQVLADSHGACVHLFERECSIQRRHQKIIEESPSPALTQELRAEMGAAAVRLTQAAGYQNAGTIEFMLDEDGSYYFLEMNTRLQVEHPVTEQVTGLDLVRLQIAIATGEPLPFSQDDLTLHGHAIEARIYAEDPVTFLPSTGRVTRFVPPQGIGIRNDTGLASGDEVTVHYDPMVAKLITYADNRTTAIERLQSALEAYTVEGVTTNLPLLHAIAVHPAFESGATSTDFLTRHNLTDSLTTVVPIPAQVLAALALHDTRQPAVAPAHLGPWRLLRDAIPLRYCDAATEYLVHISQRGDDWQVQIDGVTQQITILAIQPEQITLAFQSESGKRIERFQIQRQASSRRVEWRGQPFHVQRAEPPHIDRTGGRGSAAGHASLEAPMPGTVIKVLVEEGQSVSAHQPLMVLEAMKMEHIVAAPYDGTVQRLPYAPGALVAKGATLVEIEAQQA